MKNLWLQFIVILTALVVMGSLLQSPQQHLTERLVEERFIRNKISQEDQLQIGQTGAAVVLGGLRSLIAAVLNLQAYGAFEEEDWVKLEQLYEVVVTLQPDNIYYWETGAWHLAYNAYHDFKYKLGLSDSRRRLKQQEYQLKGEEMLLRGTKEAPDELSLWQELGRLYSNNYKPYDFPKSAKYLKRATECTKATDRIKREYFYTLGRVRGAEEEAWMLGGELMNRGNGRYSSVRSLYFALSVIKDPSLVESEKLIEGVFAGNKRLAYKDLVNYWLRSKKERFPVGPLSLSIAYLAEELDVPSAYNPLINPKMSRITEIK